MLWNERADTRRRSIAADGGRAKQNREDGADGDPAWLSVTLHDATAIRTVELPSPLRLGAIASHAGRRPYDRVTE